MNFRDTPEYQKLFQYAMLYGKAACGIKERKWYNPLRWVKGKYYEKVISPLEFYKKGGRPFRGN